jgi:hypothetical protein
VTAYIAGFDDDGHYAECGGKDGDVVTQTATAKTPAETPLPTPGVTHLFDKVL